MPRARGVRAAMARSSIPSGDRGTSPARFDVRGALGGAVLRVDAPRANRPELGGGDDGVERGAPAVLRRLGFARSTGAPLGGRGLSRARAAEGSFDGAR